MIYRKKIAIAIVTVLLVLLSAYQFNCMLQSYCAISHHLEKKRLLQIITLTALRQNRTRRRKKREYWVAPGRTSAWWDNFLSGEVLEAEWKNNFRMTRVNFTSFVMNYDQ